MEYNDFLESKKYLRSGFADLLELDISGNKIKVVKIQVLQPKNTYTECLIQNKTFEYTIEFTCRVISGPREGFEQVVSFKIPKMSRKGFVISTPNGTVKWRTSINIGVLTRMIRSYQGVIESYFFKIVPKSYETSEGTVDPYISFHEKGIQYPLKSYLLNLGVDKNRIDKVIQGDYKPIEDEVFKFDIPKHYESRFKNKLFQLTKYDLTGSTLNGESFIRLIESYVNGEEDFTTFSPFDVNFMNQFHSIIKELNSNDTKWAIQQQLRWDFDKHGSYNGDVITRYIKKFSICKLKLLLLSRLLLIVMQMRFLLKRKRYIL